MKAVLVLALLCVSAALAVEVDVADEGGFEVDADVDAEVARVIQEAENEAAAEAEAEADVKSEGGDKKKAKAQNFADLAGATNGEFAILPGLGQRCLANDPVENHRYDRHGNRLRSKPLPTYGGLCTLDGACPSDRTLHGHCAGMGVVCCKYPGVKDLPAAPLSRWARQAVEADLLVRPLKPEVDAFPQQFYSTLPRDDPTDPAFEPYASRPGPARNEWSQWSLPSYDVVSGKEWEVDTASAIPATPAVPSVPAVPAVPLPPQTPVPAVPFVPPKSPLPARRRRRNILQAAVTPVANLAEEIPVNFANFNRGLTYPSTSRQGELFGLPGCPMLKRCFDCSCQATSRFVVGNKGRLAVTDFMTVTALNPFLAALKRGFDALKAAGRTNPALAQAYREVKSMGGLCCRPIKKSNGEPGRGFSNHSWGMAIDVYFGTRVDRRGDGKAQRGLTLIAPFLNAQKLYWAGGYGGKEEDAMHFEASNEAIAEWRASGALKR